MRIIDNVSELLGYDHKAEITPRSKVRIAASTFSIFAFEALLKELEKVSELEFIFTSPSFVIERVTDKLRKERREFFIPGRSAASSLAGPEFEIRVRSKPTQRAITRECADWARRQVTFRSNATGNPMQQFAVIGRAETLIAENRYLRESCGKPDRPSRCSSGTSPLRPSNPAAPQMIPSRQRHSGRYLNQSNRPKGRRPTRKAESPNASERKQDR